MEDKFQCLLCMRVFPSKKKHKCWLGVIRNYGEWAGVRECCVAGCNNLISTDIDEFACYIHRDVFDRFRE